VVYKYIDDIRNDKENHETPYYHRYNVGPSHAAFLVYLGLDIMYNDIDEEKRKAIEDDCDYIASNHKNSWQESKYSIEGMKELYHTGASQSFIEKKNKYVNYLLSNTSPDGIYTTGPGYAYSRLYMDNRIQKKMFMDIVEYQGFKDFYDNPVFINLHEWLFGYSVTPFNRTYTFGDTPTEKYFEEWAASITRLSRFSENVEGYALWHLNELEDKIIEPELLNYLFYEDTPKTKVKPVSRIFNNGGAWLLDDEYSNESLAGVLWNVNTINHSHGHYDANSINIVGFGDFIIRNVGYDGWEEPDEKTWKWVSRNAESSNTVIINNENHIDFWGKGISEGIVGYNIEYASGHSGKAIASGVHQRNLLFIKPEPDLPGYFILYDELESSIGETDFQLMLHPNSENVPEHIVGNFEYDWDIKTCFSEKNIKVKIILGNKPSKVKIKEGYRASYEECSRYIGKYMKSTYNTEGEKKANIATVIYPYLADQTLPKFSRINSGMLNGVEINYERGTKDLILAAQGDGESKFEDISLIGNSVYCRKKENKLINYFARDSKKLIHKNKLLTGFESEKRISIVITNNVGEVISKGTDIKFYYPGIQDILVDGEQTKIKKKKNGWLKIYVGKGKHKIKLVTK